MIIEHRADASGVVHVRLSGEIDPNTVDDVDGVLREVVGRRGVARVVVDFAEVAFCDSTGTMTPWRMWRPPGAAGDIARIAGQGSSRWSPGGVNSSRSDCAGAGLRQSASRMVASSCSRLS